QRRHHLAQPARRLRDRKPHHGPPARPERGGLRARQDDAGGGRARDHRRRADQSLRHPGHDDTGLGMSTETTIEAAAPEPETTEVDSWPTRIVGRLRSGDLGSWPVIVALGIIVLVFSQTAQNFFTPGNFTNLITQMAGTCLLAYGVVFVLLIGEIDLSIAFV